MEVQGKRNARFESFNNFIGCIGSQQAAHILQTNDLNSQLGQTFSEAQKIIDGVNRADRVADRPLCVFAALADRLDGRFQVTDIVQSVENTENIDTVRRRLLNEPFYYPIFIMPVSKQVLPAQKHLEGCLLEALLEFAEAP